jgi:hypothetical protein
MSVLRRIAGTDPRSAMGRAWILSYDPERYDFARVVGEPVFGCRDLGRLHLLAGAGRGGPLTVTDNLCYRARLAALRDDAPFYRLYGAFMADVLGAVFGAFSYSQHPTWRVQLAHTGSVSGWHRDVDVTGRYDQVNVWIPFVDTTGGNALWVETDYGARDYGPVAVKYGEALIFDGGCLEHGSMPNDTDTTRVSIDLRFASKSRTRRKLALDILSLRPPEWLPDVAPRRRDVGAMM